MNVHVGGGRSLLLPLLGAIPPEYQVMILVDQRMDLPLNLPVNLTVRRISPTVWGRWFAERWLKQVVGEHDSVLCFGNLPPLNALRGRVMVFVQNRFLIEQVSLSHFPLKTHIRLWIERFWLLRFAKHANDFIVQTPSMRRLLVAKLGLVESAVLVLPFADAQSAHNHKSAKTQLSEATHAGWVFDFIYPASGDPHKNHRRLIEAWSLLAKEGFFPSLCITIDTVKYPALWIWIDSQRKLFGLNVTNLGFLPHEDLLTQYHKARALIYPSLLESFGLPLMEADEAGLAVVAAELDYVRDILNPEQVFDPLSPLSIVRAVRRFLGASEDDLILLDAKEFLEKVLALGVIPQNNCGQNIQTREYPKGAISNSNHEHPCCY